MYDLNEDGFEIVKNFLSGEQVNRILQIIENCDNDNQAFRKSEALFAIRQFIKVVPDVCPIIFTPDFQHFLTEKIGSGYDVVKSIYFDKPGQSNWFVPYHQDLTISVKEKIDYPGFGPWTVKQDQFSVQPPLNILEDNITVRIHLDNTTEANGALKVIPKSHRSGIIRYSETNKDCYEKEVSCNIPEGGLMLMKPLLLHSSGRTTNHAQRRVIHLELSRSKLPGSLQWSEKITCKACQ